MHIAACEIRSRSRYKDILNTYLLSTVREKNQSDDDVEPKQKKQKLHDGEHMLYSSSSCMKQKTWHVLIL